MQWWHIWYSAASGQKCFNELGVQAYNMFFTSLPILLLAVLDKDVDQPACAAERSGGNHQLSCYWTALYQDGPANRWFTAPMFWRASLCTLWESGLIYAVAATAAANAQPNGGSWALMDVGAAAFTAVVLAANQAVAFELYRWIRWLSAASIALGVLAWFGFAMLVSSSAVTGGVATSDGDGYWQDSLFQHLAVTPYFWLTLVLAVVTAGMVRLCEKAVHRLLLPQMHNIVAEVQHVQRARCGADGAAASCSDRLAQKHLYSSGYLDRLGRHDPANPLRLRPNADTILAEDGGAGGGKGSGKGAVLSVAQESDALREMSVMMVHQQEQLDAQRALQMAQLRVLSDTTTSDGEKVAGLLAAAAAGPATAAVGGSAAARGGVDKGARRRSAQFHNYKGAAYEGGDRPSLRHEASIADGQDHREKADSRRDVAGSDDNDDDGGVSLSLSFSSSKK